MCCGKGDATFASSDRTALSCPTTSAMDDGLMISIADFAICLASSFSSSASLRRVSGVSGPESSFRICILISLT